MRDNSSVKRPIIRRSMGSRVEMYPYTYVYRGKRTLLVWQSSKYGDRFKLTAAGKLFSSKSAGGMRKLLGRESRRVVWGEAGEMNFDRFWVALKNLRVGRASSKATCKLLLDGWNFVEDLLKTVGTEKELRRLRTRALNKAYDKFFYGVNLPSVTPEGKSYSPLWLREEILALHKAFTTVWRSLQRGGLITSE